MNILPAVKLASSAKNFLADVFGSKTAAGASGAKKTQASSLAGKTPAFFPEKNDPDFSLAQNAAILADAKKAASPANARKTPASSLTKNAANLAEAKDAPASSKTRKPASFADFLRKAGEENTSAGGQDIREGAQATTHKPRRPENDAQTPVHQDAGLRQALDALQTVGYEDPPAKAPQDFLPLEKAPATTHRVNGAFFQPGEVGFTQQELAKLRDKLLQEGLSPKSLTVLEQLASHPHGATLGQLLALMQSNATASKAPLSDEDKALLKNFADKIDNSGALGKNLLQLLEEGQTREAWDAIKSGLAAAPQDNLVFEVAEAALLCKAFGIGREASLEVLKRFGNAESIPLTPDIFTSVMLPAQQEILDKVQQDGKLAQALEKHLQPLIDEARARAELERKAADGEDRKSKQTATLIRDRIVEKFHKDVAAPEKDETPQEARNSEAFAGRVEKKADGSEEKKTTGREEHKADEREEKAPADKQAEAPFRQELRPGKTEEPSAKTPPKQEEAPAGQNKNKEAVAAKTPEEASAPKEHAPPKDAGPDFDEKNSLRQRGESRSNNENAQDAPRDARMPLSRIEAGPTVYPTDAPAPSSYIMPDQAQEQGAGKLLQPAPLAREALRQIEQGFLSKQADGGQRLELQLVPSELGAVTLILVSGKGGEISATIRSERSETAELVARHLDLIRVSLEEQGLKVDKLEVQNQMLNNKDNWQGMEQHNAMREEQERRDNLGRLRRLGRLGESETIKAREAQSPEHAEKTLEQGLHLVA